jgi:transposase
MEALKYIGMDVHTETIVIAVLNTRGKQMMESVIETTAPAVRDFIQGIRGTVHVTFEEGTQAAWLYDILRPLVAKVVVCDPRKNTLLLAGNKGDRVDAQKLAQLLRADLLTSVYHGTHGTRTLKELARSYTALIEDCTRVMNRLKALYRARAIPCTGEGVYRKEERDQWLKKLTEAGARQRAQWLYQELDPLLVLRDTAREAMVTESRKHPAHNLLQSIAGLGPVRVAQLIAAIDSPHRFRTKRQLWAYSGLAVTTKSSADYRKVKGEIRKASHARVTRGLNPNYNRTLKHVFKDAALLASARGALKPYYDHLVAQGMRPPLARLTVARKIAAITLAVWKKGVRFDAELVMPHAA